MLFDNFDFFSYRIYPSLDDNPELCTLSNIALPKVACDKINSQQEADAFREVASYKTKELSGPMLIFKV